jgi:hypothetical protein
MKAITAMKIAQGIQLYRLDGITNYSIKELSRATGVSTKTLIRNQAVVNMIDFALSSRSISCVVEM